MSSRNAAPNFLDDDDDDPFQDIIQPTSQAADASRHASQQQQQQRAADPFDDSPNPFVASQPPPAGNQNLDPFFDDDDDDAYAPRGASASSLNVFGMGVGGSSIGGGGYQARKGLTSGRYGSGNKSIEADLPLTQHAAAPAGRQASLADGTGEQDYQFAPHSAARRSGGQPSAAGVSAWFRAIDWAEYSPRELLRRQGKVVEGVPRRIALNDELANREGNNGGRFEKNSVSTGKYNVVSFLPIFLYEQFSKAANLFFLFTACIMQVPGVSPTNRYTTVAPLGLVLVASAIKEAEEDLVRTASLHSRRVRHGALTALLLIFFRNGTIRTAHSTPV